MREISIYSNFYRMYESHKYFRTTHKAERKCYYFQVIDTGSMLLLAQLLCTVREICSRVSISGMVARAGAEEQFAAIHARVGTCANVALRAYKGNRYVDERERERERDKERNRERDIDACAWPRFESPPKRESLRVCRHSENN